MIVCMCVYISAMLLHAYRVRDSYLPVELIPSSLWVSTPVSLGILICLFSINFYEHLHLWSVSFLFSYSLPLTFFKIVI